MSEKIFVGRKNGYYDRDNCFYIERPYFSCGHYFSIPRPEGPCYCGSWDSNYDFENIETSLTKKEYQQFRILCEELDSFGSGLDKPEKANILKLAQNKCDELNKFITDHLLSDKALKFKDKIAKEEKQSIMEDYNIDEDEVDDILNDFNYFDRGIINCEYKDYEDFARNYIDECYNINDNLKDYIDYVSFGEDTVAYDENYYELNDGRILYLNI